MPTETPTDGSHSPTVTSPLFPSVNKQHQHQPLEKDQLEEFQESSPIVSVSKSSSSSSFGAKLKGWFIFLQYPWAVWFIIANELCERFAFYGFKTILSKYLHNYLLFSEDSATGIVHAFVFMAYFTPLLGGFLVRFFLQCLCEKFFFM